jgi:hypothetical protein
MVRFVASMCFCGYSVAHCGSLVCSEELKQVRSDMADDSSAQVKRKPQ